MNGNACALGIKEEPRVSVPPRSRAGARSSVEACGFFLCSVVVCLELAGGRFKKGNRGSLCPRAFVPVQAARCGGGVTWIVGWLVWMDGARQLRCFVKNVFIVFFYYYLIVI